MSWTDSNTIKKHLIDLDRFPTDYKDIPMVIAGTGVGALPHRGIVANSETVKRLAALSPQQEAVTLTGEVWSALTYNKLVPQRVVVAADDGLQTVYQEEKDYIVDAPGGAIRRLVSGSIGSGSTVQVYYLRYITYTRDMDYTMDYDAGELTVKAGGTLEKGINVCVDYQLSAASGVDGLIPQAITQAEDKILSRLKDEYGASSADQGLISGATELTLSILCRSLAIRALSDGSTAAEGRARAWRELSVQYEETAFHTLRPFLRISTLQSPQKKANTSWEWA